MGLGLRSFAFFSLGIQKKIKTIDSRVLIPEGADQALVDLSFNEMGGISFKEAIFLGSLATSLSCQNIFEIGTFKGVTTYYLMSCISGKIYTLDLPAEPMNTTLDVENAEKAFIGTKDDERFWVGKPGAERIVSLRGDSATFDYSPYEGKMDFVFIDASHAYEYVKSDSLNALKMIHDDGVIVWHDYAPCWPGSVRALNELSSEIELRHIKGTSLVIHKRKF